MDFLISESGEYITGNDSLYDQVSNVLSIATVNDTLIILFDNVGASKPEFENSDNTGSGFDTFRFFKFVRSTCKNNLKDVYTTTYYCFEELLLSYKGLAELYNIDGKTSNLIDVLNYVRNSILNNQEYYYRDNRLISEVISKYKRAGVNREHFCDALLSQITRDIKHGLFRTEKTHKNGLGICLVESCEICRKSKKMKGDYTCNNCKYSMKDSTAEEKLMDISNNSLVKNCEIPFDKLCTLVSIGTN
jgi:hypothetical protein